MAITKYRAQIRHPYDPKTKSGGQPLRREPIEIHKIDQSSDTVVAVELATLRADVKYLNKAVELLNRDIGIAHSKIRKWEGYFMKLVIAALIGMAGLIVKLVWTLIVK